MIPMEELRDEESLQSAAGAIGFFSVKRFSIAPSLVKDTAHNLLLASQMASMKGQQE